MLLIMRQVVLQHKVAFLLAEHQARLQTLYMLEQYKSGFSTKNKVSIFRGKIFILMLVRLGGGSISEELWYIFIKPEARSNAVEGERRGEGSIL